MILIHAYDHRCAMGVAGRLGLRQDEWRYVMYESDLFGLNGLPMFVADDAYRNKDHDGIMRMARERMMWIWREG